MGAAVENPARGVVTAMITPFADDGSIDHDAARRLARHLTANGSDGLVVAGTTGESPTLADDEQVELLRSVIDEVGDQATIVCGTGTNDTRHAAELTRRCCEAGADAVLVVTPYYNKPNPDGIRAHFSTVAEAAGETPLIVYNIPSRTVVNIPPDLLAELAQTPNIVAVKQANNDDVGPLEGMELLAGNDDNFLACLRAGGTGGILVASHLVGTEMRAMIDAIDAGDEQKAAEIDSELREVYEMVGCDTNPIPIKAAMAMLGHCEPAMRLPMTPPSDEVIDRVSSTLAARGLIESSPS